MTVPDRAPVPVDLEQWPEARGFRRIYVKDPERQARFAMALIGFRRMTEFENHEGAAETATAIDTVLRALYRSFPEFMQDGYQTDSEVGTGTYRMDDRLVTFMPADLGGSAAPTERDEA